MLVVCLSQTLSRSSASTAGNETRVHGARKAAETRRVDKVASQADDEPVDQPSRSAVPLRWRRGRQREPERQSRSASRRAVPASLGKGRDRSASRRRLLRRASSSLARARADVRVIRQKRRSIPVNPLSKTEEAAEQKLLARLHRDLEAGRSKSRTGDETVSTR